MFFVINIELLAKLKKTFLKGLLLRALLIFDWDLRTYNISSQ